jgi:hypothetical protein
MTLTPDDGVRLRRRAFGAVLRQRQTAPTVVVFARKNFAHWLPSHGLGQDALLRFFQGRSTLLHVDPAALMPFVP